MNLRNLKIVWANLEVKALTEDLSYTWLRISAAQFSGYYGSILNLARFAIIAGINSRELEARS